MDAPAAAILLEVWEVNVEQMGQKFFCFVARAKLRSLHIIPAEHFVDEAYMMDYLASESCWPTGQAYREHCFHDAGAAARYEMETREPGWEWTGMSKARGLVLWNEELWKRTGRHAVRAAIVRVAESEWRVYRPTDGGRT